LDRALGPPRRLPAGHHGVHARARRDHETGRPPLDHPSRRGARAPLWIADLTGFVLALIIVTFLHLVVGEMAPKSWAVAHPERSAIMLAVPMRAFMVLTRPLLHALNSAANLCLRLVGVRPVDEVDQAHTSDDLRQLL